MNRIKLLLKYFIGNSFNNASSNIKSRNLAIVMYILIIIGISTPIANMIDSMYPNFASIGQEGISSFNYIFNWITNFIGFRSL